MYARPFGPTAAESTSVNQPVSAIVFLHFHESYHLGQLGYLRTWLGKSPLVKPRQAQAES